MDHLGQSTKSMGHAGEEEEGGGGGGIEGDAWRRG